MSSGRKRHAFKEIQLKDLAIGFSRNGPEPAIAWEMAELHRPRAHKNRDRVYRAKSPVATQTKDPVFPRLFTHESELVLSAAAFHTEVRLILEMKGTLPFNEDTYLYSIRVLEPAPFQPSPLLEDLLTAVPDHVGASIRTGFLVHDLLYGFQAGDNQLVSILDQFSGSATVLEVKIRRAPANQRAIVVRLTAAEHQ